MMRFTKTFSLYALIALAACGGDSTTPASLGPLKLGIISGNNQSAVAGATKLTDPVVGQMVRAANGTVGFHWVNVLLPAPAYAQGGTVVTGSPIKGAVVCVANIDPARPLTPFVPCTNTDSTGHATFFFSTGTTAGLSLAEVRGTLGNSPAVFDTVRATVLPDVVSVLHQARTDLGTVAVGDTIRLDNEITRAQDTYGNIVTDWTVAWAFSSDSLVGTSFNTVPPLTGTGRKPVVPSGARALYAKIGKLVVAFKMRM